MFRLKVSDITNLESILSAVNVARGADIDSGIPLATHTLTHLGYTNMFYPANERSVYGSFHRS